MKRRRKWSKGIESLLETKGLTKYFGGLAAVNGVNFHIQEGEIISLIGPNGAGKTTFFNLITGFLRSSLGSVFYKSEMINHLPPHQIANKGIIRTFQNTKIFPGVSVFDGVLMGCHRRLHSRTWQILANSAYTGQEEEVVRNRVLEILDFVGLSDRKDIGAQNLSYGEQRILEIAVALGADPELLLLDEPTAGMNPEETWKTMDLICKIRNQGVTMLLVEHDMNVVMGISDRVVVLDYGSKIAEGSPQEVQANEEVIKAYLGEEFLHHA
jgi:branched-chain amino acid transport system ATP-binding protein